MALTNKLTAIADAIREKGNTSALLTLDAMPAAIAAIETGGGGSGEGDDIKLHWEGSLSKWAAANVWDWYFEKYGDKITTANINSLTDAFQYTTLEEIPFDLNCKQGASISLASAFAYATKLKSIGKIVN